MKPRHLSTRIPQVNLVPMIDVLMSVLTFFVILAMTLTGQVVPNVQVPQLSEGVAPGEGLEGELEAENVPDLVVGLDREGQVILEGDAIALEQLTTVVTAFLQENPDGVVKLNADREIDYSQVDNLLKTMAEIGGDRVLLVVE